MDEIWSFLQVSPTQSPGRFVGSWLFRPETHESRPAEPLPSAAAARSAGGPAAPDSAVGRIYEPQPGRPATTLGRVALGDERGPRSAEPAAAPPGSGSGRGWRGSADVPSAHPGHQLRPRTFGGRTSEAMSGTCWAG